ncbi:hypothetical protein M405DRAFT_815070 [Rhizopogon salebrosus TDB-379]|nr:hypothetical protein M405DRAFT_815070 [Rhizopogon salebrosus TDB-379]
MEAYSLSERRSISQPGSHCILTFVLKLCLLRGLTAAVKVEFASENVGVKEAQPASAYKSPCSFEYFLEQWSNAWLVFPGIDFHHTNNPYDT